jgi:putative DNA primase/helicase
VLIGEGVETCLAAMEATAQPALVALSTAGMARLVLPPHLRTVIILADHDLNRAGQRAARAAAERWLAEGRSGPLAMPPKPGSDSNDVLVGHEYARIEKVADIAD